MSEKGCRLFQLSHYACLDIINSNSVVWYAEPLFLESKFMQQPLEGALIRPLEVAWVINVAGEGRARVELRFVGERVRFGGEGANGQQPELELLLRSWGKCQLPQETALVTTCPYFMMTSLFGRSERSGKLRLSIEAFHFITPKLLRFASAC
jgi:hypothetical protein